MKKADTAVASSPLTARYRPQRFSEVAGQEAIRAILSRAAAEDRVAPAYLFSGTRGVGKTTLARVFAKALNCEKWPAPEPCNECESCRQITRGMAVDVMEIDGASNRGIDDAKRLKEDIGYAPMQGRYKVFIIDEAHMLTREAFNALLKTLEEPPARVVFILATTEPHKFPATIISRCQHFTFKRLSFAELKAHLTNVLQAENCAFEEEAVNLLARRAAGSVRDGMSLLGQVLALGGGELTARDVREVLGLAGQDLFLQIVQAIVERDCVLAGQLTENLLEQGVDMGFFLRELALLWRNLFMLRQAGEKAFKVLDFTKPEAEVWLNASAKLSLTQIHACWQLTLEGQRRVLDSLEPGQALELLLLNMTVLPDLLPLYAMPDKDPGKDPGNGPTGPGGPGGPGKSGEPGEPVTHSSPYGPGSLSGQGSPGNLTARSPAGQSNAPAPSPLPENRPDAVPGNARPSMQSKSVATNEPQTSLGSAPAEQDSARAFAQTGDLSLKITGEQSPETLDEKALTLEFDEQAEQIGQAGQAEQTKPAGQAGPLPAGPSAAVPAAEDISQEAGLLLESQDADSVNLDEWKRFIEFCRAEQALQHSLAEKLEADPAQDSQEAKAGNAKDQNNLAQDDKPESWLNPLLLEKAEALFGHDCVKLICPSEIAYEHWMKEVNLAGFSQALRKFTGRDVRLELLPPLVKAKTVAELREEAQSHPTVKLLREKMGAQLKDCVLLADLF